MIYCLISQCSYCLCLTEVDTGHSWFFGQPFSKKSHFHNCNWKQITFQPLEWLNTTNAKLSLNYTNVISAPVLYCYVCDDCPEKKLEPLRHMRACDEHHVSCMAALTTFGEHKSKYWVDGRFFGINIIISEGGMPNQLPQLKPKILFDSYWYDPDPLIQTRM